MKKTNTYTAKYILGVRIDTLRPEQIFSLCQNWLDLDNNNTSFHQIITVNPEFVMEAQHNEKFRHVINASALTTADGIGLVMASRYVYGRAGRLYRFTGVDLTFKLAELCMRMNKRLYLLGAGQGIAKKVGDELKKKYPFLVIAGAEEGIPISSIEQDTSSHQKQEISDRDCEICKHITQCDADVLLVAFGAPKQDLWIAQHARHLPKIKIAIGVGGSFDYIANVVTRAPYWMRAIGFEWTYRLMTQPYRWRRIVTAVIRFPIAVFFSKWTKP